MKRKQYRPAAAFSLQPARFGRPAPAARTSRTVRLVLFLLFAAGIITSCGQSSLLDIINGETGLALSIDPDAAVLFTQTQYQFTASGGKTPYQFSLLGTEGSIDPDTGTYSTGIEPAEETVRVTDAYGNTCDSAVTIRYRGPLTISPSTETITITKSLTFTAFGGATPYTFSLFTPLGGTGENFDSVSNTYTAPSDTTGTAVIRVTDAAGNISDASITVAQMSSLAISPSAVTLNLGDDITFSASGGVPPYLYSLQTSIGGTGETLTVSTYTAPTDTTGNPVVRVTDNEGNIIDAAITVTPPPSLAISPSAITLNLGDDITFSASGGVPPYIFSQTNFVTGTGENFDTATHVYTAPTDTTGTATIQVTDSALPTAASVNASITVTPPPSLAISPSAITLNLGDDITFSASGGVPPYTYSFQTALGGTGEDLTGSTYTAPTDTAGTPIVRVEDSALPTPDSATATITVTPASTLAISPSAVTLNLGDDITFSASGGVPPYTYSFQTALGGTGESLTGSMYTAPSDTTGTATIQVTDNIGTSLGTPATITIVANSGDLTQSESGGDESLGNPTGADTIGTLIPGSLITITGSLSANTCDYYQINSGLNTCIWVKLEWSTGSDNFDLALADNAGSIFSYESTVTAFKEERFWNPPLTTNTDYYIVVDSETNSLAGGAYTLYITGIR